MAEYIDRKEVLRLMNGAIGSYKFYGLCDHLTRKIKELPTADVVERSRIDKAIEEIKEQSYLSYDGNPRDIIDEEWVLDILKTYLGVGD